MAEKITCTGPCGESKDQNQFYGNSKKCKTCTLARQKELKEAKAGGAAPASGKRGGGSRKTAKKERKAKPVHQPNSSWVRPAGFGFEISLQVDEGKAQTDILVKQSGTELGEQTVWLNQAEARELHSWLTEKLGTP